MKERPILFSGEMVKAILAGTKTQTRRIVKPQPETVQYWLHGNPSDKFNGICSLLDDSGCGWTISCGKFKPLYGMPAHQEIIGGPIIPAGHLWVRETFCEIPLQSGGMGWAYRADEDEAFDQIQEGYQWMGKWKPSIFIPRAASRITLEITGLRVERLQEITEADAKAEGVTAGEDRRWAHEEAGIEYLPHRIAYSALWDKINGPKSWDANPWVWVITFKRIKP